MELLDSCKINNRIKVRSVVIATIIHLYLATFTLGISLVLLLITALITNSLVKKEVVEASSNANKFKKNFPFKYYGQSFGGFQHVLSHS